MLIAKSLFKTLPIHMLLLANISQNLLDLPGLPENNLKATFCFERHFTLPKRGEIGGKWQVKMVVRRKARASLDLVQLVKLQNQGFMAYLLCGFLRPISHTSDLCLRKSSYW